MSSVIRGNDNFDSQYIKRGLLAEYTVSGSAVTSIDFSGLDINTHKSYRVEMELVNAAASLIELYCFINRDTTLTNYYTQVIDSNATAISAARNNYPSCCAIGASSVSSSNFILSKANGYVTGRGNASYLLGSSIRATSTVFVKTATVTNITQLTFTASVASSIGVGSTIRIYRGDV